MFWQIVHKEVLLHLRGARFVWVAGLFCGLVFLGLALMSQDYARRLEAYQTSVAAERRELLSVDGRDPVPRQVRALTGDRGVYAFRPPVPLGPLASGLESAAPMHIHVSEAQNWSRQASEVFYRNPLLTLFPRPDLASVVASILSLVALFFTFDAVCGEKEGGTLRLMLSAGVSRDRILLGKWAGATLTLGAPFLLAVVAGVLLFVLMSGVALDSLALARIAGMMGLALVYMSLFVTVGLCVSTFTARSSSSLLICLTVWVGATFVLPHLLTSAGAALAPAPTFQQLRLQRRAVDLDLAKQVEALTRQARGAGLSDAEVQRRRDALRQAHEAEKARIDEAYVRRVDQQTRVSQALSRLSPAACLVYAAAELADTGLGFYRRAHEAFGTYRRAFHDYAQRLLREADAGRLGRDWLRPEEAPALLLPSRGLEETLGAAALDLLVLLLFHAAAFAAAYVLFLRYDVR
jgi:ABC-2 type transport system permease protein